MDVVMDQFAQRIDAIEPPEPFLLPEPQASQTLTTEEEIKEMHWTQKTLKSGLLKKCAAVLLDFKQNNETESDHQDYSWLALVAVEDATKYRVKILNVGSKVVHLADALLLQKSVRRNALLCFPIDEKLPEDVEEFRLAPCRVMHLHAAHVNMEWQNIHTEQFEPRLRRYVQSQLNARIAKEMFNPTLKIEGAHQGTNPFNVQDDITVERQRAGYINRARPKSDPPMRQHVSAEQRTADDNFTFPRNASKRAKKEGKPMSLEPWMAKLLSVSLLRITYFDF